MKAKPSVRMGRKAKGLPGEDSPLPGYRSVTDFARSLSREVLMARLIVGKIATFALCLAVLLFSLIAGTVLSDLLVKASEL